MDMKNLENKKEIKSETKKSKKQKQLHAGYFAASAHSTPLVSQRSWNRQRRTATSDD
jgi:hypothetical protein